MNKPTLYMAAIGGWTEVRVFSTDPKKAKKLAIEEKKKVAPDEPVKWNWKTMEEYFGAKLVEISEGTIVIN